MCEGVVSSTAILNDFRDDVAIILQSIGYETKDREDFNPEVVQSLRTQLQNLPGNEITTEGDPWTHLGEVVTYTSDEAKIKQAYLVDSPAVPSLGLTSTVGKHTLQQDILISTLHHYNLAELKRNQSNIMQEINDILFTPQNRQLGGKVDRMEIISAQKGYAPGTLNPLSKVVGGLMITLRLYYKSNKCN